MRSYPIFTLFLREYAIALILLFGTYGAYANTPQHEEVFGILVDRTLTRSGREFYTRFSGLYNNLEWENKYNIVVQEVPIPKLGTRLNVSINHQNIFSTYFGRKPAGSIDNEVKASIKVVYDYINSSLSANASPDMAPSGY